MVVVDSPVPMVPIPVTPGRSGASVLPMMVPVVPLIEVPVVGADVAFVPTATIPGAAVWNVAFVRSVIYA